MDYCGTCSKSFIRKSALLAHNEDKHHLFSSATSWTCDIGLCRRSFGKESSLWQHKEKNTHMRKPRDRGPYKCDVCSDGFSTDRGMQQHRRDKHGSSAPSFAHTTRSYAESSSSSESDDDTDSEISDIEDLLDRGEPDDVEDYISDHLQPDKSYSKECSSVVEHLANFFKTNSGFTVNRFIKGGSLGKGTAIKSKSDVDCVMFISELPPIGSHGYSKKLKQQLDELENTLQRSKYSIAYDLAVVDRTSYAVKLRVQSKKADREPHDVDLLLASDMLGQSPTSIKKDKVYKKMGELGESSRQYCSAALVELQRDFVEQQDPEVKALIRLVKMWKASCVTETSLTSYPLELLCIHTWPSHRTVPAAFKAVLQKLSDYSNICAYWTVNYIFTRVVPMLGKRPLILDPANPYNNVADRCRDWSAVAQAAQETLWKPFFSR